MPAVEVDIGTMATRSIEALVEDDVHFPLYMIARNDCIMYVSNGMNRVSILKNNIFHVKIDILPRYRVDKTYYTIRNRWHQQFRVNVFLIDIRDDLYCICSTEIEQNRPIIAKLVDSKVEDFYINKKGMAIVYKNGCVRLPESIVVESKAMPVGVGWSHVVGVADRWIVAGDLDDSDVLLATLSKRNGVQATLTVRLTHNGFMPDWYSTLKYLKVADERRNCALVMAFGFDSCCHLISMRGSGRLILVQSIASILDTNVEYESDAFKTTFSVIETGIKGRYLMTGFKQINMIYVKFK